jgi:hypothetical protein
VGTETFKPVRSRIEDINWVYPVASNTFLLPADRLFTGAYCTSKGESIKIGWVDLRRERGIVREQRDKMGQLLKLHIQIIRFRQVSFSLR